MKGFVGIMDNAWFEKKGVGVKELATRKEVKKNACDYQ